MQHYLFLKFLEVEASRSLVILGKEFAGRKGLCHFVLKAILSLHGIKVGRKKFAKVINCKLNQGI